MFGERQKTNEFLRDPEFFELLLLDPSGEFVFEGFLEDPRLFASEFVMMPGTSSSSSADRMMVGEVHLEAGGVWRMFICLELTAHSYRLRNGLSSGSWRQFCRSSGACWCWCWC